MLPFSRQVESVEIFLSAYHSVDSHKQVKSEVLPICSLVFSLSPATFPDMSRSPPALYIKIHFVMPYNNILNIPTLTSQKYQYITRRLRYVNLDNGNYTCFNII